MESISDDERKLLPDCEAYEEDPYRFKNAALFSATTLFVSLSYYGLSSVAPQIIQVSVA